MNELLSNFMLISYDNTYTILVLSGADAKKIIITCSNIEKIIDFCNLLKITAFNLDENVFDINNKLLYFAIKYNGDRIIFHNPSIEKRIELANIFINTFQPGQNDFDQL